MRKPVLLSAVVIFAVLFTWNLFYPREAAAQQSVVDPADAILKSRVPVGTIPESGLDFTQVKGFTGNVSVPIPILTIGGVSVQLQYYSQGIASKVRTENQYAPSGSFGFGWQLLYGTISGEINGSADTSDDHYYYNGPDGSFELQEDSTGVFRIPNYKPWLIQRVVDATSGIITGWIVTKEDGTILRFGNYYRSGNSYNFSPTEDSTYATRFNLGYAGLVANPDPKYYSGMMLIPYQWDLSSVQDIEGNFTTLVYQQVQFALITPGSSPSALLYTRESHPSKILDNKGQEADFTYSAMNSNEFYDSFASFDQNLVDTLYLNNITIKGNGQAYKKIVFQYRPSSDILGLGIAKRYLTGLSIQDGVGDTLPSYSFSYCGSTDLNPGALNSVSDPSGGTASYVYKTQTLNNVSLSKSDPVSNIDYWKELYGNSGNSLIPKGDGLAGKDFILVPKNLGAFLTTKDSVYVWRRGPLGWFRDMSLPDSIVYRVVTSNDFAVLEWGVPDSGGCVIQRTQTGWKIYDVAVAIHQAELETKGYDFDVVGAGPNYFVARHNVKDAPFGGGLDEYNVSIVMLTPIGLKVFGLPGNYWDGGGLYGTGGQDNDMRAFCGENYMILESYLDSPDTFSTVFSHFKFVNSVVGWKTLLDRGDCILRNSSPSPSDVCIGKNFVICRNSPTYSTGIVKVYRCSGSQLDSVEQIEYSADAACHSFAVGDDYYTFACEQGNTLVELRTWDGTKFRETDLTNTGYSDLAALGNRLVISWSQYDPTSYRKLGYLTLSPANYSWSSLAVLDSSAFGANKPASYVISIDRNTFVELWYQVPTFTAPPAALRLYQFRGTYFVPTSIVSIPLKSQTISGYTSYENPSDWLLQSGQNFLAMSRHSQDGSFANFYPPDSVNLYTLNQSSDGTLQFTGSPTVPVLSQRILTNGMGDSAKYRYTYDSTSGVFNEYLTTEYAKVKEVQPGNNDSIVTSYYTRVDSFANGINYKFLDGMAYDIKDYNNQNILVNETKNAWTVAPVDPVNGVFFTELLNDSTIIDGVPHVTSYQYEDLSHWFMMNMETETNSDGIKRITRTQYPGDYNTRASGTADSIVLALRAMNTTAHIVNAPIERSAVRDSLGNQLTVSGDLTTYKLFGAGQILPQQSMKLRAAGQIPISQFTQSYISINDSIPPYGPPYSFSFDSRYVSQETYNSYDGYGHLLQSTDANGTPTAIQWGYNYEVPVSVTINGLCTTAAYDPATLQMTSRTDPNGNTAYYAYDSFQRPASVKNFSRSLLKDFSYYYSLSGNNGAFNPSDPNYVRERDYRSANDFTTSTAYTDGLGRKIETRVQLGSGDIVSVMTYDLLGRSYLTYKPYQISSHAFDPLSDINTNVQNYYSSNLGLSDPAPFSVNDYYDIKRLSDRKPEGTAWQTGHYVSYIYGSNAASEVGNCSANTLNKTTTVDENAIKRLEFKDDYGNLVQTVTDSANLRLITQLSYDIMGNLLQSIPPNGAGYKTIYSYNTLSQLTQKTSPDAGTVQYLYDKNGNLRLIQDANHTSSSRTSEFIYRKYDQLNRMIEEGEYGTNASTGDFTQQNADNTSFPTSNNTISKKFYFDAASSDPNAVGQRNLKGKLSWSESYRLGSLVNRTIYSYDEMGRVEWMVQEIVGNHPVKLTYQYDLQGNVTQKGYVEL